jgi:hypothetical protein
LLALGAADLWVLQQQSTYNEYSIGNSVAIALLLIAVVASYCQTVFAYPSGGGSFIVAKDDLGTIPELVAAAALLIDYILMVAVSVEGGHETRSQDHLRLARPRQRQAWFQPTQHQCR